MSCYYNSELIDIKNIYLKPELGINIVSDKIKKIFRNKFFESKIKQEKCNERLYDNYYFFYCSKDVNINEFGKLEFILKRQNMRDGVRSYLANILKQLILHISVEN